MKAKYEEHPVFEKPYENAKIWKYMDFTKFVSLLDKKALFFCRANRLVDRFEGSYPKLNVASRKQIFTNSGISEKALAGLLSTQTKFYQEMPKFTMVNCWNISDCESAAFWELYLSSHEGIAIQSTFSRLVHSFNDDAEIRVHVGKVRYVDYQKDRFSEGNLLYPFTFKRKSFGYENELRAVIIDFENLKKILPIEEKPKTVELNRGENVDINLDVLLENVYVSPTSQQWFMDLVESVMKKYDITLAPIKSNLEDDPVY